MADAPRQASPSDGAWPESGTRVHSKGTTGVSISYSVKTATSCAPCEFAWKTSAPPAGFEPTIFGLGVRRLVHWAKEAVSFSNALCIGHESLGARRGVAEAPRKIIIAAARGPRRGAWGTTRPSLGLPNLLDSETQRAPSLATGRPAAPWLITANGPEAA